MDFPDRLWGPVSSRSRLAAGVSLVRFPVGAEAGLNLAAGRLDPWGDPGPAVPGLHVEGAQGQADRMLKGRARTGSRGEAGRVGWGDSPCSSLLAAARRVEDVLPVSVLGVPGRLLPRELPPDCFRSLLGGVFFFCGDRGWGCESGEGHPVPHRPGLGLTAMKSAEEASLSMSLSSELSDSSLLSAWGQRRGVRSGGLALPLSPIPDQGPGARSGAANPPFLRFFSCGVGAFFSSSSSLSSSGGFSSSLSSLLTLCSSTPLGPSSCWVTLGLPSSSSWELL